jgi:GntR family transcriptional regulator
MRLEISDESREPLQHQIIRQIRAMILSGEITAGEALPSIRMLSVSLGVSVITVQRAYESLQYEGLVHARRSKGYFVSPIRSDLRKNLARKKLSEKARPVISNALKEGLTPPEVKKTLNDLVEHNRVLKNRPASKSEGA